MNAKEISDATLPAVTPADNDLMIIYDTSEGTTGKATIADIFHNIKKVSGEPREINLANKSSIYSDWYSLNSVSVPSGAFVLKAELGYENINISDNFSRTLGNKADGDFNFVMSCNFGGVDVTGSFKAWAIVYYI